MYDLKNVGDIGVYYEGVTSVLEDVTVLYNELKSKIDDMNQKKEQIPDYWASQEANNFIGQMNVVSDDFVDFCTHYDNFIQLLSKVMELYQMEEESILEALKKYEGVKDSV